MKVFKMAWISKTTSKQHFDICTIYDISKSIAYCSKSNLK